MATLEQRLEAIRKGFEKKAPPAAVEVMHRATRDLATLLDREPGLTTGDTAPAFCLPGPNGDMVDSTGLLQSGPLVVTFFRGHW